MLDCDRLPVYRDARAFRVIAKRIASETPRGESDLGAQLRSAANSIVENIGEGAGEFAPAEKARFYRIARRSATECVAITDMYADSEYIDALPQREKIRAHLPQGVAERVLATPGLSLLDGADHQALVEASYAELDRDGYLALIRHQTAKYRESPMLAATVRTLQRLLGRSAHGLLKHLPRLRDVTVQGYGTLTYQRADEKEARFILEGYPIAYMTDANRELFVATFLGALDILDIKGEAITTREDRAKGAAEYTVRWT